MLAVKTKIKLNLVAKKATPAPPVGQSLGQYGIDIMAFCREYNARTKDLPDGTVAPIEIVIYENRSFSFVIKTPPTASLIKEELSFEKGSVNSSKIIGTMTRAQVEGVAKKKLKDLNTNSLDEACKIVAGTARSMGIKVEEQ